MLFHPHSTDPNVLPVRKFHGVFPNNNLVVTKASCPWRRNFYFDFLDYFYESQKLHSAECFCSLWYAYFAMKCKTSRHSSAVKSQKNLAVAGFVAKCLLFFSVFQNKYSENKTISFLTDIAHVRR